MKFEFTSKTLDGSLIFDFTDDGDLAHYYCNAAMTAEQKKFFISCFPLRIEVLNQLVERYPQMKISEIPEDINFDMFYNRYDVKRDKVAAQKAWKKLSQEDQVKAYRYALRYKTSLPAWQTPKYPATYLNDKPWLD